MSRPDRVRVAAIQMQSTPDESANLARAERWLGRAVTEGAELVAFPENLAGVFPDDHAIEKAEPLDGPRVRLLRGWAKESRVWLLAGSIPETTRDLRRIFNTSLLIDADGEIRAAYRKIHLFDAEVGGRSYRESDRVEAGRELVVAETPWGTVGLTICYDLRFPELFVELAGAGARILFVPSAFTRVTGEAHWEALVRGRAIDAQAFLVAPGQWGVHCPGRESFGHSQVVDPWGRVLARCTAHEGVVAAELDLGEVERVRARIPLGRHRRARGALAALPARG